MNGDADEDGRFLYLNWKFMKWPVLVELFYVTTDNKLVNTNCSE